MNKLLSIFITITLLSFSAVAQEENTDGWKNGGMTSLNMSQVSLTNWAAGGENSLSGNFLFNGFANMKKGEFTWDNTLDFGYGL